MRLREPVHIWLFKLPEPEAWSGAPRYRVGVPEYLPDIQISSPSPSVNPYYEFELKKVRAADGAVVKHWVPTMFPDGARFKESDQMAFLHECLYWQQHKESLRGGEPGE